MSHEYTPHKNKKRKIRRMLKLYFRQHRLMMLQLKKTKGEIQPRPVPKIEPLKNLLMEC